MITLLYQQKAFKYFAAERNISTVFFAVYIAPNGLILRDLLYNQLRESYTSRGHLVPHLHWEVLSRVTHCT